MFVSSDWQGRIWSDGDVLGMLDATKIDRNNVEGTEAAAQKAWMRVDTKAGRVISTSGYATGVNPVDGTIWVPVPTVDGPQNKIFDPKKETGTVFRLPYPLPFYTRGLDGRIDNPSAGWKGRGIWTSFDSYLPKFSETRLGYVNHIQYRPNPLAN